MENIFQKNKASWIWLPQKDEKFNQYVEFRHEFILNEIDKMNSNLYISVDTEYAVWINGNFLDCNQYDDFPAMKVFDILDAGPFLKPGKNMLCVLAYYQGDASMQYIKGIPRLIYTLEAGRTNISSGEDALCRESRSYMSGSVPKVSPQLSYSFEYNAMGFDGWLSESYKMGSEWVVPAVAGKYVTAAAAYFSPKLTERPIKKLAINERVQADIITQGIFIRMPDNGKTVAHLMQTDFLSHRNREEVFIDFKGSKLPSVSGIKTIAAEYTGNQGLYMVIDLGREEAGFLELELEAVKGAIVDVAYGEQLDDLRVRAYVGGRNFAARYTCSEGKQCFTHCFKRIAGRYLELHVSNCSGEFILHYAGIRPVEYPVETKGSFSCPDHLFNRINEISVRTLKLCMHEHYEDTPWREQALYGMDSRMQALCGYYCFGEYDFPISSFELLGNTLKDDGYIEICAPTDYFVTIPSFNMAWIMELGDYLMYSGKTERIMPLLPKVKKMLDSYLLTMSEDLMVTPSGKRYWNFYEWAEGLDNGEALSPFYKGGSERFDAPLNLFLCMALDSAIMLAECCGDIKAAAEYGKYGERVRKAFHQKFWDEKNKCYKTYAGEGCKEHYSELVQALAVCAGACPADLSPVVRERLAEEDNKLVKATISYSLYKYQALMSEPEKYGKLVFESIANDWGYMLYNKATSFWETIKGANDFNYGGSLSHGWSATPIYFFYANMLGIRPLQPGFKTFEVEPAFRIISAAEGKVPTPYGDITVKWKFCGDKTELFISYPPEIKLVKTNANKEVTIYENR